MDYIRVLSLTVRTMVHHGCIGSVRMVQLQYMPCISEDINNVTRSIRSGRGEM